MTGKRADAGVAHYMPINLGEIPDYYRRFLPPIDVACIKVCARDENGYYTFGGTGLWHPAVMECARIRIVEVCEHLPRTHNEGCAIHESEVDFVIGYQHRSIEYDSSAESILIGSDKLIPVCKPKKDGSPMFDFGNPDVETPFLEYGDSTPIGAQLKPILISQGLTHRLRTVYENSMGGALRIRARSGDGVAWLSQSLVQPDLENKLLVRIGDPAWDVDLDIRLYRNADNLNQITRSIWSFLKGRQAEPMVTMD